MKFPQALSIPTTRITPERSSPNGYFSFKREDQSVEKTFCAYIFEALRRIKSTDLEVFQLCDVGDTYEVRRGDDSHYRTFLVHVDREGNTLVLSSHMNIKHRSDGKDRFDYYEISFGAFGGSPDPKDDRPVYYGSGSEFFERTPAGLQRAVNCFSERLISGKLNKPGVIWYGYTSRDEVFESCKTRDIVLDSSVVQANHYEIISAGDEILYQRTVLDEKEENQLFVLDLKSKNISSSTDLSAGYTKVWTLSTTFKNPPHGTPFKMEVKIDFPTNIGALSDAENAIMMTYLLLRCSPNEKFQAPKGKQDDN